ETREDLVHLLQPKQNILHGQELKIGVLDAIGRVDIDARTFELLTSNHAVDVVVHQVETVSQPGRWILRLANLKVPNRQRATVWSAVIGIGDVHAAKIETPEVVVTHLIPVEPRGVFAD